MRAQARIPATIVTGFLGSGKTTLLRHILANAGGRRIAVIVNEFGELGIDGEILRGCGIGCDEDGREQAGQLFELANGCLCCTVQEEFYPVMRELIARRDDIDHILIETSGLALPKPLVQAFNWPEVKTACTVDAVITVVDVPAAAAGQFAANPSAVDAQRRADPNLDHESPLHELFEDQLSAADLVVLSKLDLVDDEARAAVETLCREELPPAVKLVAADHGRIDLDLILGLEAAAEDSIHLRVSHHDHEDGEEHDHNHEAFQSISVELPVVDRERLLAILHDLVQTHTLYRVKGFVALADKPMRLVVHGVGRRFDSYFDRRWRADEARHTHLVLIGQDLDAARLTEALQGAVLAEAA
ncbi:cobalamin biosynthesis protein CobW [Parazoarcus communis]|mgnify:CR=1 FL=1|uniref:Cobalamin biosynthesis protein CobW n=1 Tax=Parazoarcus communis SWub3 = DSM 12120 TaxID=1121029 RepID=A0A323UYV1_9RHOO|nr:cobalamin biosynthesis protein CobW [Parazoarcus communis]NMG70459.1 cobalamin biosynthesis protein CobW [Parazoarcus communis SWub3 = DSM 12120]PZA17123.1 cobalamin biosynthesis protein CobW [Azoarcus communis] [Parazoarcus communis SWub3 = DSM 12120]